MISSLPARRFVPEGGEVRLSCMLNVRAGDIGICALSTWLSSNTSPVLISFTALSTLCGFMWLAAPRSSVAPHFEGQRALSGGGVQDGVWAEAVAPNISVASKATGSACDFMAILPSRHNDPQQTMKSAHAIAWARVYPWTYSWHGHFCRMAASATKRKSCAPASGFASTKLVMTCSICSGVVALG